MTRFSSLHGSCGIEGTLPPHLRSMTAKLEAFLQRLEAAQTRTDLQTLVEQIRDVYGVENVVYHAIDSVGDQFAALTYDPKWEPRYREQGYVRTDPVVQGALRRFQPLDWKRLDWSDKASREMFAEFFSLGMGNQGYTVPIRGPRGQFAMFSVNDNASDESWAKFTREYARDMLLVSHYLHQTASEIVQPEDWAPTRELSPRERDALALLGSGMARGRVAERLTISEHTLRVYIDTARAKLGALNTAHAIALAQKYGLIII